MDTINALPQWTPDLSVTRIICGYFEFENSIIWPLLDTLESLILLPVNKHSIALHGVKTYIDLIMLELNHKRPGSHSVVNQLAKLLFIEVLRQQIAIGQVKSGLLAALFDNKISRALAAVHNNPERSWSLQRVWQNMPPWEGHLLPKNSMIL
ncbi:cupin domain-containing protein [Microbulbifer sp. ZKSA006]|uniref:cupin domain-containing protein n=1 Tax=Microbulbifer sp. ZKSA006 TaxID=3243390 RepID=UPI00403940D5